MMFFFLLYVTFSNYGPAVAAITGAHNLFLECSNSANQEIKNASSDLLSEADQLHTSYVKMNVISTLMLQM